MIYEAFSAPQILGITPLGRPDFGLAKALCVHGAQGFVDLGTDRATATIALQEMQTQCQATPLAYGVRISTSQLVEPDRAVQLERVRDRRQLPLRRHRAHEEAQRLLVVPQVVHPVA